MEGTGVGYPAVVMYVKDMIFRVGRIVQDVGI